MAKEKDKKKEYEEHARLTGQSFLGESEIEVDVVLTTDDRCEFGKAQSEALAAIAKIDENLAEQKAQAKAKKEAHIQTINETSVAIRTGKRKVVRRLPAFLDRKGMKVWLDLDTGEEVFKRPATDAERQTAIV